MIANNNENNLPRIGQIDFCNCLPINLPIKNKKVSIDAQFLSHVPSKLNSLIEANQLDVSAVSLFCYIKNSSNLKLVSNLSVSSLGAVGSVLFFYKGALEDLGDTPILVPTSSATSTNLLSIIIEKETGKKAALKPVSKPDIEEEGVGGALIIGDEALVLDSIWSKKYNRIDLGQWWWQKYNLPTVFGVWVARKHFIEQNPDSYKKIESALNNSRDIGLTSMLPQVVDKASKIMNLPESRVESYFVDELDYTLTDKHFESIKLYTRFCDELGLLDSLEPVKDYGLVK